MKRTVGVPTRPLNEEIVLFDSSDGHRLPGIWSRPGNGDGKLGLLLLSPGLKHRVGPHRLHVKLARLACDLGLHVFRFDFHGTGDADGELPEREVPILHERIQNGYFTEDGRRALEAFCERSGVEKVITCGLCGGAITALYVAAADRRVDGIIGFQLPVKVLDQEVDFVDQISEEYSDFILTLYLKKLFSVESWRKFLGGKSEYGLIWKTATRKLGRVFRRGDQANEPSIPDDMNRFFLKAYDKCAGRVKMQWIYSGDQERARYDFEGDFEQRCLAGRERPYERVVIPETNHEFATDEAQERLFELIEDWLTRQYGVARYTKDGD